MRYAMVVVIFFLPGLLAHTQQRIRVGMTAPEFQLPYATEDTIVFSGTKLSDYEGKSAVILAFYPADWSGGCTKEVCTIRDNFSQFSTLKAEVLGISGDYVFSHHEWAQYHHLPFKLLSDHDHRVAAMYDSYNEGSGMNKRTVIVIDKQGIIRYTDLHYDVSTFESFTRLREAIIKIQ